MFARKRAVVVALAALVVVAFTGDLLYKAYQKREQQRALTTAIRDTTARLRETLEVAPNASATAALPALEKHAGAADALLEMVRKAVAAGGSDFAQGAEIYVLKAGEIFRRQAASISLAERASASRQALAAHMGHAARRDESWIREALSVKKTVEGEYFDYNLALTGLSELLRTLPDAKKRLAPHVDAALLLETGQAEEAQRRVVAESKRVAEELDQVRRLPLGR
jgi:hypothetical protein